MMYIPIMVIKLTVIEKPISCKRTSEVHPGTRLVNIKSKNVGGTNAIKNKLKDKPILKKKTKGRAPKDEIESIAS